MNTYQDLNREKLVAYFQQGAKEKHSLGFELEHILLHAQTGAPVSYSEPGGVRDVLEALAPSYERVLYDGEDIVGLEKGNTVITLEPAAQLEISAGPFDKSTDVEAAYRAFRSTLDPVLDQFGLVTPFLGYQPSAKAADLELIPKFRYESMTRFLGAESPFGICMMRGTASLQISIDYADEADAITKLRVAEKLTPILALICDNSPIFENEPAKTQLARTGVWAGMNQDRVGCVPGSLDPAFSFAGYADYILTRGAILVPDAGEPEGWCYVANATFDEVYAEREMTTQELEHALSMVWPDARLKNFVEVRPADAMPERYAIAYVALIQELFYRPATLAQLDELLNDVDEAALKQAKDALMAGGYEASVYGKPATYWADLLMELTLGTASDEDKGLLTPLAELVAGRQTLAQRSEF